jgi:hypothetical protein
MDSILRSSIPTMLLVIIQHIDILTVKDLTPKCIKVSHFTFEFIFISGLRANAKSSLKFKLFILTVVIIE